MFFKTIAAVVLAGLVAAAPVAQTQSQINNAVAGTAAASLAQTALAAAAGFNATGHPGVANLAATVAQTAATAAINDAKMAGGLPIQGANPSTLQSAVTTAAEIGTSVNALGLAAPVNVGAQALASAGQTAAIATGSY